MLNPEFNMGVIARHKLAYAVFDIMSYRTRFSHSLNAFDLSGRPQNVQLLCILREARPYHPVCAWDLTTGGLISVMLLAGI
jgi:hypothetical protein